MVRGAIFDALAALGAGLARVLDAYAGSGALGIEALSRGADWCDLVESSEPNVRVIRDNLRSTDLEMRARVHNMRVERAAGRLEGPYTLVLADPPYDDEDAPAVVASVAASKLVSEDTTLVLEQSSRQVAPERLGALRRAWNRRYGDTQVSIYRAEADAGDRGRDEEVVSWQ